jgi:predicted Fe-Mo cluster-binding NifX family protein
MKSQLWFQMKTDKQNRLRVAIPTSDGVDISPGMLGRAKYLFVYEIEDRGDARLV